MECGRQQSSKWNTTELYALDAQQRPMKILSCSFIASLFVPAAAATVVSENSPRATALIRLGPAVVLKNCTLKARRCHDKPLIATDVSFGDSNDQPRSAETLSQPGMRARVIFDLPSRRYTIEMLTVTRSSWIGPEGLRVGDPRSTVLARFGKPREKGDPSCDSYFNDDDQGDVKICYTKDRVHKITWGRFVD